jgi:hypothetical protein
MVSKDKDIEWLVRWTEEYHSHKSGIEDVVEELEYIGKLGWWFSSVLELEEIDIGNSGSGQHTFVNANLGKEQKEEVRSLLKEFIDCFSWEYTDMSGLCRKLVEHRLAIKPGFRPHRQPARSFNAKVITKVKDVWSNCLKPSLSSRVSTLNGYRISSR